MDTDQRSSGHKLGRNRQRGLLDYPFTHFIWCPFSPHTHSHSTVVKKPSCDPARLQRRQHCGREALEIIFLCIPWPESSNAQIRPAGVPEPHEAEARIC